MKLNNNDLLGRIILGQGFLRSPFCAW